MFGKLPRYKIECVVYGFIANKDGTVTPDDKPYVNEYYCGDENQALQLGLVFTQYAPGCIFATVYDNGKKLKEFDAPIGKKKHAVCIAK